MKSIQNSIIRASFLALAILVIPLGVLTGCGEKQVHEYFLRGRSKRNSKPPYRSQSNNSQLQRS